MKLVGFSCVFSAVMLAAMGFFLVKGNSIVLGSPRAAGVFNVGQDGYSEAASLMNREFDRQGYVTIPLPENVGESDITIQNNPYEKTVWISINNVSEDYYHKNLFSGEMDNIESIRYGYEDGLVRIVLNAADIFEPRTEFEDHRMYLRLVSPHDIYEHVVVIDPGHGGEHQGSAVYGIKENDIVDGVTERLKNIDMPSGIGIYYTRAAGEGAENEDRLHIAETVSADLLVSIHTNADSMSRTTTGSGAATLSANSAIGDLFGRNVSEATGLEYAGVQDGSNMTILKDAKMPSVLVELGYITNKKEAMQMATEEFQSSAAEAIAKSITEYFENEQTN